MDEIRLYGLHGVDNRFHQAAVENPVLLSQIVGGEHARNCPMLSLRGKTRDDTPHLGQWPSAVSRPLAQNGDIRKSE
jgi:hypothetical protein